MVRVFFFFLFFIPLIAYCSDEMRRASERLAKISYDSYDFSKVYTERLRKTGLYSLPADTLIEQLDQTGNLLSGYREFFLKNTNGLRVLQIDSSELAIELLSKLAHPALMTKGELAKRLQKWKISSLDLNLWGLRLSISTIKNEPLNLFVELPNEKRITISPQKHSSALNFVIIVAQALHDELEFDFSRLRFANANVRSRFVFGILKTLYPQILTVFENEEFGQVDLNLDPLEKAKDMDPNIQSIAANIRWVLENAESAEVVQSSGGWNTQFRLEIKPTKLEEDIHVSKINSALNFLLSTTVMPRKEHPRMRNDQTCWGHLF